MNAGLLKQMTWRDVQEVWWETEQVLRSIPEEPDNWPDWARDTSTRFGYALNRLRGANGVPPPLEQRYDRVLSCAERTCGHSLTDSRDKGNTLIRCFVAYTLQNEGYSYSEIGKMMKRNHSTITHLANRMRDMLSLPRAYKFEVQQYKRFEEML